MRIIQKGKGIIYSSMIALYAYLMMRMPVHASGKVTDKLQKSLAALWDQYWFYCAIFVSIGVLTGILAFIVLFIRLGHHSSNPQERSRITKEMIAVAGCTAALGSITLIVTLYFSLFNN